MVFHPTSTSYFSHSFYWSKFIPHFLYFLFPLFFSVLQQFYLSYFHSASEPKNCNIVVISHLQSISFIHLLFINHSKVAQILLYILPWILILFPLPRILLPFLHLPWIRITSRYKKLLFQFFTSCSMNQRIPGVWYWCIEQCWSVNSSSLLCHSRA